MTKKWDRMNLPSEIHAVPFVFPYFGSTTGQLWIGRDGGEDWSCLFNSLLAIHRVKVAVA